MRVNIKPLTKICLAGILTAVVTIFQKILAVNYIPVVPFLRISFGGPALIIFCSILLGPLYGLFVGCLSDVLGFFIFDPKTLGFFPQITAIYTLLGFCSYFIFCLVKKVKKTKRLFIIQTLFFALLLIAACIYILPKNELILYKSTYQLTVLTKTIIISVIALIFILISLFSYLMNRIKNPAKVPFSSYQITFSLSVIEILVMILFGSLMKGWAFGFQTIGAIVVCQILVGFINVIINSVLITLFLRITTKFKFWN